MIDHNLKLKEKESILFYLAGLYLKAIERKALNEEFRVSEKSRSDINDLAIIRLFNQALTHLNQDEQRIIQKDYLEQRQNQWYLQYYSRSTYYRIKQKALDCFLQSLDLDA